jgi:hypothetical protein
LFADASTEPPPVRTPAPAIVADAPERVRPWEPRAVDPVPIETTAPPGRATVRLIRRMRWRFHRPRRRLALLVLAAAAAFAWFSPSTRAPTREAWRRAGIQMQIMFDRMAPGREAPP